MLLAKNYEYVEGAQISNSFICLLALSESEKPMSSTDVSKYVAKKTGGQIYKVSATIKESLENRLKNAGYVKGTDIPSKKMDKDSRREVRSSLYTITSKGRKLLDGWIAFLASLK
jgi:DNA-binding PadR family transcriptional regulator